MSDATPARRAAGRASRAHRVAAAALLLLTGITLPAQDGRRIPGLPGGEAPASAPGRPPRDVSGHAAAAGEATGIISGRVVVAGAGTPARGARVTLNPVGGGSSQSTTTDDEGRYAFVGLTEGSFQLAASKPGHVSTAYGAYRPGRPGVPIRLAKGERYAATLPLARGGVITGTVLDEYSEPGPGIQVRVLRRVPGGLRPFGPAGAAATDDRGVYRIFGLLPGDYLVSAVPRSGGPGGRVGPGAAALRERLGALSHPGRGGIPQLDEALREQLAQAMSADATGYAPIYYPGTLTASQASPVALDVGEERTGVDFQLQRVAVARVEGTVVTPAADVPLDVQITLADASQLVPGVGTMAARADGEGRFSLNSVPPGTYRLMARAAARGGRPGPAGRGGGRGAPEGTRFWGAVDLTVDGRPIANVVVTLQPALTVSGTAIFEGAARVPEPGRVEVALVPADPAVRGPQSRSSATLDTSGRFTVTGVYPGVYRIQASGAGPGWWLESASLEGQDALDGAVEVQAGRPLGAAALTFSDRAAQLAGTLTDAGGRPATGQTLILYPADSRLWLPQSRWIRTARPDTQGQYTIASLPPGEYRIAALVDVEPGAWFDPAFLQQLEPGSSSVALRAREHKVYNLRVSSPPPQ